MCSQQGNYVSSQARPNLVGLLRILAGIKKTHCQKGTFVMSSWRQTTPMLAVVPLMHEQRRQ